MITIYSTVLIQQGRVAASKLVAAFIEITFPIMLFFAGIVCIISPVLSNILAPGFVGEEHDLLIKYCRILSISFVFVSFEMVFGSVLDSEKSFFIPRLQSLINSACMIGACFFLVDYFDVGSLIIAQYLSSIIYAVLLFAAMRKYINVYFVNPFKEKNVIAVLKKALPLILGNSVLYVNGIVDRMIASNLDEGTVSSLTYCHVLEDFVINVIVVNICNVLFAHFADIVAHNDSEQITRLIYQAIAILVTILTPVAIVTFLCSEQIVSIAYYRGDF